MPSAPLASDLIQFTFLTRLTVPAPDKIREDPATQNCTLYRPTFPRGVGSQCSRRMLANNPGRNCGRKGRPSPSNSEIDGSSQCERKPDLLVRDAQLGLRVQHLNISAFEAAPLMEIWRSLSAGKKHSVIRARPSWANTSTEVLSTRITRRSFP